MEALQFSEAEKELVQRRADYLQEHVEGLPRRYALAVARQTLTDFEDNSRLYAGNPHFNPVITQRGIRVCQDFMKRLYRRRAESTMKAHYKPDETEAVGTVEGCDKPLAMALWGLAPFHNFHYCPELAPPDENGFYQVWVRGVESEMEWNQFVARARGIADLLRDNWARFDLEANHEG
jgi:hypothetical protein